MCHRQRKRHSRCGPNARIICGGRRGPGSAFLASPEVHAAVVRLLSGWFPSLLGSVPHGDNPDRPFLNSVEESIRGNQDFSMW